MSSSAIVIVLTTRIAFSFPFQGFHRPNAIKQPQIPSKCKRIEFINDNQLVYRELEELERPFKGIVTSH